MADLKTKPSRASVATFLAKVADDDRRRDCHALLDWMGRATGAQPKMWGPAIVGFGSMRLEYDSGRQLDWFPVGFAARKHELVLYGLLGEGSDALLARLGKHSRGKGCLYIKRLEDVDATVLRRLIDRAAARKSS